MTFEYLLNGKVVFTQAGIEQSQWKPRIGRKVIVEEIVHQVTKVEQEGDVFRGILEPVR